MPSSFAYATFANYSPRGTSELSRKSQALMGHVKRGRRRTIESAANRLQEPSAAVLRPFLNPDTVLVPVPRSALLVDGALWPGKEICDVLVRYGFGSEVRPLLQRITAVRKSSTSSATDRPEVKDHLESIEAEKPLFQPDKITIVDDVLTRGATTYACAKLLSSVCPNAEIRIFAILRSQGLVDDIEKIVDPSVGEIIGYSSGKVYRKP